MDLIADHIRELLDSGPDALVVADESGVIVYVNRQTEVLFGFERNGLLGKKVEMLLPERLRATHPSHRRSYGTTPRVRPMGGKFELYAPTRRLRISGGNRPEPHSHPSGTADFK